VSQFACRRSPAHGLSFSFAKKWASTMHKEYKKKNINIYAKYYGGAKLKI
jgi:hypothetical protein